MQKYYLVIFFCLQCFFCLAQDTIILNNGKIIVARDIEVRKEEIKYHSYDIPNDINRYVEIYRVFELKFANGTRKWFPPGSGKIPWDENGFPITSDSGYVITLAQDTIYGVIKLHGNNGMRLMSITLKKYDDGKKTRYRADKLKSFYFGKRAFDSMIFEGAHYYFEKILEGPISLYQSNERLGTIGTADPGPSQRFYYLLRNTGLTRVPLLNSKEDFMKYVEDDAQLIEKISQLKIKYSDLRGIVEEYNLWILSR